jgi:two-component system, NarL family, nitrate/nitrite response regulator NarL
VACLKTVAGGQCWLPEKLVAPAVRRAAERRERDGQLERVLSAREYEIARLVGQGLSNKHIARALTIAEGTVKIHLHNVYEKLGALNRTSLAVLVRNAQGPTRTYAS